VELVEEYLKGAIARFKKPRISLIKPLVAKKISKGESDFYKLARPGFLWDKIPDQPLPFDGGRSRKTSPRISNSE
jgi:hypothetical protein